MKMKNNNKILQKKLNALTWFKKLLLKDPRSGNIARILLFGSTAKGTPTEESDVDLLVLGLGNLEEIQDACAEAAFETAMEFQESIEPLVYCIDEAKYLTSYFIFQVLKTGKEVYKMNEEELKKRASRDSWRLSQEYLGGAETSLKTGFYRGAIDTAYNAAELAAKSMLISRIEEIPKSHGGVINRFGELFVKTGIIPKELGTNFSRFLDLRNKARYDFHFEATIDLAEKTINFAKEVIAEAGKLI